MFASRFWRLSQPDLPGLRKAVFVLLAGLMALTSCAPTQRQATPAMPMLSEPAPPPPSATDNPGSLFDAGQSFMLFDDDRARRVGDIVMVVVNEGAFGEHEAETEAGVDNSDYSITARQFFGHSTIKPLPIPPAFGMKGKVDADAEDGNVLDVGRSSDFKGDGKTSRTATLTTVVGARVVNVLPNGLLEIEGAKQVRINNETQFLVVRGLVRVRDIASDNTIDSDRLANSTVEYYGQGVIADKQKPGWLARVLDNIWPF